MSSTSGNWSFITYDVEGCVDRLRALAVPCALSPIHDQDEYDSLDVKKWRESHEKRYKRMAHQSLGTTCQRRVEDFGYRPATDDLANQGYQEEFYVIEREYPDDVIPSERRFNKERSQLVETVAGVPHVGMTKKAHRHVLIQTRPRTLADELFWINEHGFPEVHYIEQVEKMRGMTRYLCHLDDADKTPYSIDDVISFKGFNLDPLYEIPRARAYHAKMWLLQTIDEQRVYSISRLANMAKNTGDPAIVSAFMQHGATLSAVIRDRRYELETYRRSEKSDHLADVVHYSSQPPVDDDEIQRAAQKLVSGLTS